MRNGKSNKVSQGSSPRFYTFFCEKGRTVFLLQKCFVVQRRSIRSFVFSFPKGANLFSAHKCFVAQRRSIRFSPCSSAVATEGYARTYPFSKNSSITPRYFSRIPLANFAPYSLRGKQQVDRAVFLYTVCNCIPPVGRGNFSYCRRAGACSRR